MNLLRLVALLYASMAAPRLPANVEAMFEKDLFKVAFLALIIWVGSKDLQLSVLLAIGFVVSVNHVSGRRLLETFRVEQNTSVMPACVKMTPGGL